MSLSNNKFSITRNLGFITGPLMIIMGIVGLQGNKMPMALSGLVLGLGIVRLGLTIYSYVNRDKNQ